MRRVFTHFWSIVPAGIYRIEKLQPLHFQVFFVAKMALKYSEIEFTRFERFQTKRDENL